MGKGRNNALGESEGSTGQGIDRSSEMTLDAGPERSSDDMRSHNRMTTQEQELSERHSSHTMTEEKDTSSQLDSESHREGEKGKHHQRMRPATAENGPHKESKEKSRNRDQDDQGGESDFKQEEMQHKKPGKPSQQPNSQEAHVDPGYHTLNPWYGQPSDRGPTFSTAWPFPRTVRPGMLNGLDDTSLLDHGLEVEHADGRRRDVEKHESGRDRYDSRDSEGGNEFDYLVRRIIHELRSQGAHKDSTPPDIRSQRHRPTTQTMPSADSAKQTMPDEDESAISDDMPDEVPADIRPEGKRPTVGVPPQDETDTPSHHLTNRGQKHGSSNGNAQNTKDHLRRQASAVGQEDMNRTGSYEAEELRNTWARLRARAPEPLAEYVATTVSLYIGLAGSVSKTVSDETYGTFHTQALCWGFGVMCGIYIAGGISGAHLNPAISITLSLFRGFPWRRCGIYIIAQSLGGLTAAGLVWLVYRDSILRFDPTLSPSVSGLAFFTLPQPFISRASAFANEFLASVILMIVLLALGDDTNAPPGAGMNAFILGLLVTALVFTSAYQTGVALNPARDLGPRIVALWAGYPRSIFLDYSLWWLWGAIATPLAGCMAGCTVYDSMVFTGGESPLNYRWPTKREVVDHLRGRTKRVHDHVNAHARIRFGDEGGAGARSAGGRKRQHDHVNAQAKIDHQGS